MKRRSLRLQTKNSAEGEIQLEMITWKAIVFGKHKIVYLLFAVREIFESV